MKTANRCSLIPASPTLAVSSKARALKAAGVDVISFSAGEPDFRTPDVIVEAAKRALDEGVHYYTSVNGTVALREAICSYLERRWEVSYAPNEVIVSTGAKQALYNLFLCLLNPGDEVLLPAPSWVSYPTQVTIAEGKPVIVPTHAEHDFVPTLEALDAATTARTRAIVLNIPTNPSGAVWSREALESLAGWLRAHPDIVVVSDSIYNELVYDGASATELLAIAPDLRDRYVLVNGFSKSFAMTGWRLGYAAGPAELIGAMAKRQSQSTSNANSMAQAAAIVALDNAEAVIPPMLEAFEQRRDLMHELLTAIPDVRVAKPKGAFYMFPDLSAYIGRKVGDVVLEDDLALASWLLDAARVAVVPGSPFGSPGFVRLSYSTDEATIREGVGRIREALATLPA